MLRDINWLQGRVDRKDNVLQGDFVGFGNVSVLKRRQPKYSYEMALASSYSTVTDLARFRGWSTSHPRRTAMW
jgi:hypothetical protein